MTADIAQYDVLIIGAGLSGIGAAYHIQKKCPNKSFAVLEARESMGGTWDLFRYPGIRSDSDMYTLGFSFNPWKSQKAIADGPSILNYIKDTAKKFKIDTKIRYNHRLISASWSDTTKKWKVQVASHKEVTHEFMECKFLYMCAGYYDYDTGHTPEFPNSTSFKGTIVHPQKWDATLDYQDKKVVVIGSGAAAVTLVPELAKKAKSVAMLQRSPTYIMNLPSKDVVANALKKVLPGKMAFALSRWKNISVSLGFYFASRKWPRAISKLIQNDVRKALGPQYDMKHFSPKYKPWDQRLCVIPDSDLFDSITKGKVTMVTDAIEKFTENGLRLASGKLLDADIIVTATGLKIQLFGGIALKVNDQVIDSGDMHCYRGVLLNDIPNFAVAVGYTHVSWTLKCELSSHYVTRLLNYMDEQGYSSCIARYNKDAFTSEPLIDSNAGYILRAENILPKQGSKAPWKVYQNYLKDILSLRYSKIHDKYVEYS